MDNEKIFAMSFSKVYPLLVAKAEKKGRTKQEVDEIIHWLCGYDEGDIANALENEMSYGDFFRKAPAFNPDRKRITGRICGVRLEEMEEGLMKEIRYLDKLVDELAKGKAMEKILRKSDE